jgi:hypothetical protein
MQELKVKFDESDVRAIWDHSVKSRAAQTNRFNLLTTYCFFVLFLVFAPALLADEQFQVAHYVVALGGIGAVCWHVLRATSARQAREWIQNMLQTEEAISFSVLVSPSQLTWKGKNVDIIVEWAGIEAVEVRNNRLIVQMTPDWAIVIPSRVLPQPEYFPEFAAQAIEYWTRNREHPRCPDCDYDLRASQKDGCPECGWQRSVS